MNNEHRGPEAEKDEALSSEYRRIASESVPPNLDRAVLREARRAVRRPSDAVWSPFLRPLTIIASIAVALAIVLQFSELELNLQGDQSDGTSGRAPVQAGGIADPGREAADRRFCSPEQAASRESWATCIDDLRDSGRPEEARHEQALFDKRYGN